MRENRPSGLMRGGASRSWALCLFNPSTPPTLLISARAPALRWGHRANVGGARRGVRQFPRARTRSGVVRRSGADQCGSAPRRRSALTGLCKTLLHMQQSFVVAALNMTAIEINQLAVHAARRGLLDVEQLQIPGGEIVAVMGRNGAGKTTVLRSCLGFVKPSHGTRCACWVATFPGLGRARCSAACADWRGNSCCCPRSEVQS
jgi:hypothetical protein